MQYFFVRDQGLSFTNATASSKPQWAGGAMTYRLFPAGEMSVNVRFDNLADWFDDGSETKIDVTKPKH